MAWSYRSEEIASVPWLVRKITVTATDTTGEALVHGGPAVTPDFVIPVLTSNNPTGSELSVSAKTTTTITVDAEAGSKTAEFLVFWFAQGAQDGSSIGT